MTYERTKGAACRGLLELRLHALTPKALYEWWTEHGRPRRVQPFAGRSQRRDLDEKAEDRP